MWTPLDDSHTMVWTIIWNPTKAKSDRTPASLVIGRGDREHVENTTDGLGRCRMRANKVNDY